MNMKSIIATAAIALTTLASANAGVQTYQGSTRWASTLFTPGVSTGIYSTTYTSYYVVETRGGYVVDARRIDAWTTASGRFYYVDDSFSMDYDYFGFGGYDIAGGMESVDISTVLPFRGVTSYGRLSSFILYPAIDYYPNNGNLDITTITGSARLNTYFSGNVSLNTATNRVLNYLESRGYYEY
jgi:hypothetical protein